MTMPSNKEMRILADEMVNRFLDEHERLQHEVYRSHAQLCDAQRQIDILADRAKRAEKRAAAYINLLVEIAHNEDNRAGVPYMQMIRNLDKLLAQEEEEAQK